VPTPQHVAELIDIEAVCLEVGEHRGLVRRKALGSMNEPAAVTTVSSSQLDEKADPGAHAFSLLVTGPRTGRGARCVIAHRAG
jgi:hypothetical protein